MESEKYPQTQAALDAYETSLLNIYESFTDEQVKKIQTNMKFKKLVKELAESEGMVQKERLVSKHGLLYLECGNTSAVRISKESLTALGPLGKAAVGLFNEVHKNDEKGKKYTLSDKTAHDITTKEIMDFIKVAQECAKLYEEYQANPQEFLSQFSVTIEGEGATEPQPAQTPNAEATPQ